MSKQSYDRIVGLHDSYIESGYCYLDQSTAISKAEWEKRYQGKNAYVDPQVLVRNNRFVLERDTNLVSRGDVLRIFESARKDEASWTEAFLACMAWGFRANSYGAYRTSVMLSNSRSSLSVNQVLANVADDGSPVSAYKSLAWSIKGLGPAFGTKFLYFSSRQQNRAPILDAVVARWLKEFGVTGSNNRKISSVGWSVQTYSEYLRVCEYFAEKLNESDLGLIEYLIFVDSQFCSDVMKRRELRVGAFGAILVVGPTSC